MKKTLLKLLLVCLIASCCLFVYKTLEFMYKTSAILEKYENEITILKIDLYFQTSKLTDVDSILERQLNDSKSINLEDIDESLDLPPAPIGLLILE